VASISITIIRTPAVKREDEISFGISKSPFIDLENALFRV